MLKTEIFDILLPGEFGVGEVALGKLGTGEVSDWGS